MRRRYGPVAIVAAVALGLLAVAAVMLLVDPFGWNLLDKVSGLRDEAAAAMPATTGLYAEIDLVNFSEETLTEFSQPFVVALAEPGVEDLVGGLERLDELLATEIGVTLRHDVMPWLGRSVGLGLTGLKLAPDGQIESAEWLLVAGTQDRRAAAEFLEKLGRQLTALTGVLPAESRYRGRTITVFDLTDQAMALQSLAFTRSAGQVIIGADEAAVRAGIDAQRGQSLADEEAFQVSVADLPDERGLTLYADQSRLPELSRLAGSLAPLAIGPLDLSSLTLPPGAVGVSIIDEGLRLDSATPLAAANSVGDPPLPQRMAGLFPGTTLAYFSGDSLNGAWQSFKESLAAGGNLSDFEESMALLSRDFGLDPDSELLPLLDGEWTLAVLPARQGLLADQAGLPLGMVLLAETTDPQALADTVAELNQGLTDQRLPLETVDVAGATATIIDLESLLGGPLPLYGVDGDYLFLGTDAENVARVLSGENALDDDARYAEAKALLPEAYETGAYIDVSRLRMLLADGAEDRRLRLLAPVSGAISGSGPAGELTQQGVTVILIE